MPDDADQQFDEYGLPLYADIDATVVPPPGPAPVTPPVAPSPSAPAIMPPAATQPVPAPMPILPPTGGVLPPRPISSAEEAQRRIDLVNMSGRARDLAGVQTAVDSAMHFQAIRGYQDDIAAGKSPAEALAKWAPLMYLGPKSSSLGQAGAFIRGARAPAAPRPQNIGGVAYVWDQASQSMRPVTPTPMKEDPDAIEYQNTRRAMDAVEKSLLDPKRDTTEDPVKQQRLRDLGGVAQAYQMRLQQKRRAIVAPPSATQPATATASTGRVRVRRPDGKIGNIPASQLQAAIAAGYTQVQ